MKRNLECHDVLEELWSEVLGDDKKFYQGLIQASVALFHFGNENLGGARKLYHASREKLEPYGDYHLGLDLKKRFSLIFNFVFRNCWMQPAYPADVVLKDERVPKIVFPAATDNE